MANNKTTYRKVITLPNGKRKWLSAKSEEELKQKVMAISIEANLGIDVSNNITFGEFAKHWYHTCKETKVGINMQNSVLNALNNHILPYISGIPLRDIAPMQVQYIFTKLDGKSQSLISKVRITLKEIFDTAVANRIIMYTPMVGISVSQKEHLEKRPLTKAEEAEVLNNLRKDNTHYGRRAYLFALIGFKTGLRRGELAALMLSDFDLTEHTVKVDRAAIWPSNAQAQLSDSTKGNGMKSKAAHRTVPIPDSAYNDIKAELMEAFADGSSLYLFHGEEGNMLSMRELRNLWNRVVAASPVKFSPHQMRHTYCTRICSTPDISVKEAQYFMGHSTPEMTMKVYNHLIESEQLAPASARIRSCI